MSTQILERDSADGLSAAFEISLSTRCTMLLVAVSGASALIVQTIFIRALAIVLGNTLYAFSCVVTAFLLGLSIGGFVIEVIRRRNNSWLVGKELILYGVLELLIGMYVALAVPSIFNGQAALITVLQFLSNQTGLTFAAFAMAMGLLIVPTTLMGATIPLLASVAPHGRGLNALYCANTYGAVAGVALATVALIPRVGCDGSAYSVLLANLIVAAVAIFAGRRGRSALPDLPLEISTDSSAPAARPAASLRPAAIYCLAFFSGFVFLAAELLWARRLSLILGNRVYVTAIALGIVLLGIAAGSQLASYLSRKYEIRNLIAVTWGIAALAFASEPAVSHVILRRMATSELSISAGEAGIAATFAAIASIAGGAILLGVAFPTLLIFVRSNLGSEGRDVGAVFAINTLGSVIGSLLTAFVLLHYCGTDLSFRILACLLLSAVLCFFVSCGNHRFTWGALAALLLLSCWTVATIGDRQSPYFPDSAVRVVHEDEHGLFQVVNSAGRLRTFNNATELVFEYGSPYTRFVQEMQAHLPMLFRPDAARVANIGTGYGITTGAFTLYRQIEHIDTVEIVPALFQHAGIFEDENYAYFRDRRVRMHATDGRNFLALENQPFDVISVNVSDPYIPGSASLFSLEFYALCARRLTPDGVLCQHVFGPDVGTLLHGISEHFPHVIAIPSYRNGYNVIASRAELGNAHWDRLFGDENAGPALVRCGVPTREVFEGLLAKGRREVAVMLSRPPGFRNTDARPVLEYRTVSGYVGFWHSNN